MQLIGARKIWTACRVASVSCHACLALKLFLGLCARDQALGLLGNSAKLGVEYAGGPSTRLDGGTRSSFARQGHLRSFALSSHSDPCVTGDLAICPSRRLVQLPPRVSSSCRVDHKAFNLLFSYLFVELSLMYHRRIAGC